MNRAERRAKMRRKIGRAALALLAAATLALSPLGEDMALAGVTDDLTIYGGGGGGGGSSTGGGGGGYVRYGNFVVFGGGADGGSYGGSIGGGTGIDTGSSNSGGGVGHILGSSGGGIGDSDKKVKDAVDKNGVDPQGSTNDIPDLTVDVYSGNGKSGGSSFVTLDTNFVANNFKLCGGNGGDGSFAGTGGNAIFNSKGYALTLHGNLTVAGGNGGDRGGNGGNVIFSSGKLTLYGDLTAACGKNGPNTSTLGGNLHFEVPTLVAAKDGGVFQFEQYGGELAFGILTLELQGDTTMRFGGQKHNWVAALRTIRLNGGVLTIEDDAAFDNNKSNIVVAAGSGVTTLVKASSGNKLSGTVKVSSEVPGLIGWQVIHNGDEMKEYVNTITSINLNDGLTNPTEIRAVLPSSGNLSPPGFTGFTVSTSADPAQGGVVSGGGSYSSGAAATLKATARPGYTFTGWTVDGADAGGENPLRIDVKANTSAVAHFYKSDENTYPDPVGGKQTAIIGEDGVAVVSLMADNARGIVGNIEPQAKGKPGIRVARLNADTGKAKALCLRMSAAGLQVLRNAKVDAFELCSGAVDIYLDKQMLSGIYSAASSAQASYRILVLPGEGSLTLRGDLGEGSAQEKGKGLLTLRLPMESAVSVANAPSFYDGQKKELVLAPKAYGGFTLAKRAENKHWAADYMAFAKITGQPDAEYKDKSGKTYTRTQFAQKLYAELEKDEALPQAMRALYPFKDTTAVGKAAIVLQQAGVAAPLSDGTFSGKQTITNAQAAAWLARLDWLQIDPLSPFGWAYSDDGASMYYSFTGSMVNYEASIGGKPVSFNKDGFLTK